MNLYRLLFTATGLLTMWATTAQAIIIGADSFDYPDGAIAGRNGGLLWNYKSIAPTGHSGAASTWDLVNGTPQITAGKLVTFGNSATKREYRGDTETQGAVNDPTSVPSSAAKKVYYKVTVTTGPSVSQSDYFGISSNDFNSETIYFGKRGGSNFFGVEEVGVGGSNGGVAVQPNMTYTLVTLVDYANDFIRLYVNPNLNGGEPGSGPTTATRGYTGTNWSTAVRFAAGTSVTWDDLIVATEWDDLGAVIVTTAFDEDDGGLGGGDGVSLREAVKYSSKANIVFASFLSGSTIDYNPNFGEIAIPTNRVITVDATALPGGLTLAATPINSLQSGRHFTVPFSSTYVLRGLTLRGGQSVTSGGSIRNEGGRLVLDRCIFTENISPDDGGAILSTGPVTATDCHFSNNLAGDAGGAVIQFSGEGEYRRCTFSGSVAARGAGFWKQGADSMLFNHCTLTENCSTGPESCGGVQIVSGSVNFRYCTIVGNIGNQSTGGVRIEAGSAVVGIFNSIIASNGESLIGDIQRLDENSIINAFGVNFIGNNFGVGSIFPTGPLAGTLNSPLDPRLSPLGFFGGRVPTLHPLIGSRVMDAAEFDDFSNPSVTDARGLPRAVDADGVSGSLYDLGAVEAGSLIRVDRSSDDFSLTLRQRLSNFQPGVALRLGFAPAVFPTEIITLTQGEIQLLAGANIFIDASDLGGPVTISGNNAFRLFNIPASTSLAQHSIRLADGRAPDAESVGANNHGGGIFNQGSLSLFNSIVANCRSGNGEIGGPTISGGSGGGIYSVGQLSLHGCTVSGNQAGDGSSSFSSAGGDGGDGGGICSHAKHLSLTACTLAGNKAGNQGVGTSLGRAGTGGAIRKTDNNPYRITACAIATNQSSLTGGISGGDLILRDSIVAQNTGPDNNRDLQPASLYLGGKNLIGSNSPSFSNAAAELSPLIVADPRLAPLGAYGGFTQTMALRPGSPARDAAVNSRVKIDQRGFIVLGLKDIGAYEAGNNLVVLYNPYIWETLPHTAISSQTVPTFDFDGDGASNQLEWLALTNAADPASTFRPTYSRSGADDILTFPTITGRTYRLETSENLFDWAEDPITLSGNGAAQSFIRATSGITSRFYRITIIP